MGAVARTCGRFALRRALAEFPVTVESFHWADMLTGMPSASDYRGEPSVSSAFGCLLILAPFLAFFFVWPDAIHVWRKPWSYLSLWIVGAVVAWLLLTSLLKRAGGLAAPVRVALYGALVAVSAVASVVIATSV